GGLLGLLIPPSIEMIVYSTISGVSVGKMYLGGIIPGLIMAALFVLYIGVRCHFNPELGPARVEKISWLTRVKLLRNISMSGLLVLLILGGIYTGTFTPTEASGIGSAGAIIIAGIKRTLTWRMIADSCKGTIRLIGMIFWLMVAASGFSQAVIATEIGPWLTITLGQIALPFWMVLAGLMVILMVMGTMMGDLTITLLMVPITTPVMAALGVDPTWFALLFVINMITAWLTPPYGTSLFLMRLLVPEGVTMGDIYRSVIPFSGLMFLTLILCAIFPELVLFLPRLVLGG
ncbi:MAG: TRAP transporter large permease subunit, partial [Chloroflexota bacterium]